jgi:hypothetical protein
LNAQSGLRNIGIVLCVVVAVLLAVNLIVTIPANLASISLATKAASETSSQTGLPVAYPKPVDVGVGTYWYSRSIVFTSMVANVEAVGFRINSDSQVTLTLRYSGRGTAPAVTVIVSTGGYPMAYPSYPPYPYGAEIRPEGNQTLSPVGGGMETLPISPEWYPYPTLIGSDVVSKGWSSPEDVTLGLVGDGSVYDATSITVTVIPFTG